MSLDSILQAIEQRCAEQVQEIERLSQEKICALRLETQAQADQAKEQAFREALRPAYRERARLLHQAYLDTLKVLECARRQVLESTLDEARGLLAAARASPDYPGLYRYLVEQALQALHSSLRSDERPRLLADVRDRPLLESLLDDLEERPDVDYDLTCWGGLIAQSQDGRVVVENLLERRLERAWPQLGSVLAGSIEAA